MKIVIVGGVAGGATTAARLRRLNEENEIIMLEKDEHISFANCGLPYYIGNVIKDRSKLIVQTVESLSKRFNIDIRNYSLVTKINKEEKYITVKNLKTNEEYKETYDKLVLSPGANPIKPPIPGIEECNNIFTLRNIPDTDKIYNYINDNNIKHATVIGGGFIGVEMAENLKERNIDVTLVDMAPQIMAPADFEMAQLLHIEMNKHNVNLILNDGVKSFKNNGSIVETNSGKQIQTDMIILAIGVLPASKLAIDANLELGIAKSIKVNQQLLTSDKDIYAIGDVIEVNNFVDNSSTRIPLAWPANRQGKLVADHICNMDITYNGTQGSSVLKVFDLTFASTGLNERTLKNNKVNYGVVYATRGNHASYYPNATEITLKLLYDKDTLLVLGAQAIGKEGTEKRIDVIATAIRFKAKVTELSDLELCYAPPFGSAKDPVNILGYIAENIINDLFKPLHWNEVDEIIENKGFILDVRNSIELQCGCTIDNAINIELDILRDNLDKLPQDKSTNIYVTCAVGHRGYIAARILKENGYKNIYNLLGGIYIYSNTKYNIK